MLHSRRESLHRNGITDLDLLQQTSATKSAQSRHARPSGDVRYWGDCVAKLDEKQRTDNNRIGTNAFLNQYCALRPDLESMLLTWAHKIVFATVSVEERT
jgi:hypothetical protein